MPNVHVWVAIDEQGDYAVSGASAEEAMERYGEDIGTPTGPMRVVEVSLGVPLPVPVKVSGTVPAEAVGEVVLTAE